eukprot:gene5274-29591_t
MDIFAEQGEGDAVVECPVCLDPLGSIASAQTALLAPCGHVVCHECGDRYANADIPCPVCRAPIDSQIRRVYR